MSKAFGSGGRPRRRNYNTGPRKNERIRALKIRVIGPDGSQIGIMSSQEALKIAKEAGLDLVEISASARPPVCRILDYGKYMYEQSKKTKDNKATTHKLKEVKFRVRIEEHDYITKLRHAEEFLDKGSKVKVSLMFRGREMEHKEIGFDVVNRAVKDLDHIAQPDTPPRLVGRNITMIMSPLPANKKKLKYTAREESEDA